MGILFGKPINHQSGTDGTTKPKSAKKQKRLEKEEKKRNKKLEKLQDPPPPSVPQRVSIKFHESDYEKETKRRMKKQLAQDTTTFLLNQMMAAVQFYGNYER